MMLTKFLDNLRIGQRLTLGFGLLLVMIVLLGGGVLLLNSRQASSVATLNAAQQQNTLSAQIKSDLLDAREEELSFLLRWRFDGFDAAYNAHVTVNQQDMQSIHSLVTQLRANVGDDQALSATLDQIDQQATAYETTFADVIQLIRVRGFVDTGLEGQFRTAAHQLEAAPQFTSNSDLLITLLQMRRHEKDYFLRADQTYLDQTDQANAQLQSQIGALNLSPIAAGTLFDQAATYLTDFNLVVDKDNQINAGTAQLETDANTIEPVVTDLAARSQQQVDTAVAAYNASSATARALQIGLPLIAVVLGLGLALLIGRSITQPLLEITGVASGIGAGNLDRRSAVTGRNEIGVLAGVLNKMAQQLQDFLVSLEIRGKQLEARTRELTTTVETGRLATSIRTQNELLPSIVEFIRERFNLYYTQIYLVDEAKRFAILRAGSGDVGRQLLARNHRLDLGQTSLVAAAIETNQTVLVSDTEASTIHKKNALLPDTRSEATIPLIVSGETLGVLDMQSGEAGRFNEDNLPVFEAMASQIASSLSSARSYDEAQAAVRRAEAANRRVTKDSWESYLGRLSQTGRVGYEYNLEAPVLLDGEHSLLDMAAEYEAENAVTRSITLRGQPIGSIVVQEDENRHWTSEEVALIDDVAQRVAQASEQLRAFEETQKRAAEMETVAQVSATAATVLDLDDMLQSVVDLTKESFNLYHAHVYLMDAAGENLVLAAGAGEPGRTMKAQGRSIPVSHPHSLVARAGRTGAGVIANDVTQEADFLPNPLLPNTRSEMAVPMIAGSQVIGVLDVQSERVNRFDSNDVQVKTTLAEQTAIAVQNARAFQTAQDAQEEARTLYEISSRVNEAQEEQQIVDALVPYLSGYNVDGISLAIWGDRDFDTAETLEIVADWRIDGSTRRSQKMPITSLPFVRYFSRDEINVYDDVLNDPRMDEQTAQNLKMLNAGALVLAPLTLGQHFIGGLNIVSHQPRVHTEREIRILRALTEQITATLERIHLSRQAEIRAAETAAALAETESLYQGSERLTRSVTLDAVLQALIYSSPLGAMDRVNILLFNRPWVDGPPETSTVAALWEAGNQASSVPVGTVYETARFPFISAFKRDEPMIIEDVETDSRVDDNLRALVLRLNSRCLVSFPVLAGEDWIASITALSHQPAGLKAEDARQVQSLVDQAGAMIQNIRLLEESRQTADRLREVDRLKSQFLANMSHELRTPLNSIIGYSEVMLDGDDGELSDEAIEDVQTIHNSGHHLLAIINDILDLAKIEAGQMRIGREEVNMAKFASDVVHAGQILVKDKPVTLALVSDGELPPIYADPIRLRQIIWNLISNAVKFTENGAVTVSFGMADESQVFLKVQDSGIGMKPEDLPKIFEQFRQVDGSSTRRAGGTGLGLTITRLLVQMHGGDIHVESEYGVGSTFWFTLPVQAPEKAPAAEKVESN